MAKSLDDLSKNEKKFLKSVIGKGKKTDTDIAGETGLSVSTVNRIRHKFEDEDIIKEYISVIDLEGVSIKHYSEITLDTEEENLVEHIKTKNVVFAGKTDEASPNYKILMGHTNYEDYLETTEKLRNSIPDNTEIKQVKLIPEPDSENFVLRGRSNI